MTTLYSRRSALSLFAATLFFAAAPPAFADKAAEAYVERIGKDVLRVANGGSRSKATRTKFASLLGRHVNLRGITMASLGTYQKGLPPGDKDKLNSLVTTYAAALFAWYVDDFKGKDFVVDRAVQQGKFTLVYGKIVKSGGSDEPIVFYLSGGGGSYRITDISVLGVRLSSAMRQRFTDELKKSKGDFGSLYAMLREAETW